MIAQETPAMIDFQAQAIVALITGQAACAAASVTAAIAMLSAVPMMLAIEVNKAAEAAAGHVAAVIDREFRPGWSVADLKLERIV